MMEIGERLRVRDLIDRLAGYPPESEILVHDDWDYFYLHGGDIQLNDDGQIEINVENTQDRPPLEEMILAKLRDQHGAIERIGPPILEVDTNYWLKQLALLEALLELYARVWDVINKEESMDPEDAKVKHALDEWTRT